MEASALMLSTMEAIAILRGPYRQKFAIPRQPNLVPEAIGRLEFQSGFDDPNCLREIEQFSHLWLLFEFHAVKDQGWSPTVQPPRLGGKNRVGVYASRSPFRPNGIGMSAVRNLGVEMVKGKPQLLIGGIDLLDGTPILDIKPYLPYADVIDDARGGYAIEAPASARPVEFSDEAQQQLATIEEQQPGLQQLIASVLSQDPRPAWRVNDADDKQYGMALYDWNIKWRLVDDRVRVITVLPWQDN